MSDMIMDKKISILIADDHDIVRIGLRHMLEVIETFTIIGEVASGEEALEKAVELKPDIVLMDVRMPGIGGIEATHRMERRSPASRMVITFTGMDPMDVNALSSDLNERIDAETGAIGGKAEHYHHRAASLRGWNDKALLLLPLLDKLFSLPAPFFPFNLFGKDNPGIPGKAPLPSDQADN